MAVSLAESAKLSTNQLVRGVMETFLTDTESVVLDQIQFEDVTGNAWAYNEEATLPGVAFRDVNEAYTESTGTLNTKTETLKIFGGDADVDRFIEQTRGNLASQRATQTALKIKALRLGFQTAFINGDSAVNPKSFDGLKKRLVGSQVIDAATNGLPVFTAANPASSAQDFFDALDALIAAVPGGANALYMNAATKARIKSAARRLNAWDQQRTEFGKSIDTYNGVALLDMGNDASGNPILPQTETQGTANDASSIYAVRWSSGEGDVGVLGLWNGGLMVDDLGMLQSMPVYRTRIELYGSIAVLGKGAARLRGVRVAAS
ncbi:major capsid protein [Streptomyces sp. NPDC052701]|uniref:major capsid protein n=1 Tax=Streptomyces sp. NPDC052701 TaxID=3155533 RepID=UPI003415DC3D